eukprot:TRINITY_DN13399_c0_g1_i1.p1 TRINITY_DN13399_c0_g1~~TRINITY_DN13399_c0_g1_i1.p1  ORF type:complete len:469 (-),score=97.76 TRINITY_DN13399_c0_g1_i1:198-1604(-)
MVVATMIGKQRAVSDEEDATGPSEGIAMTTERDLLSNRQEEKEVSKDDSSKPSFCFALMAFFVSAAFHSGMSLAVKISSRHFPTSQVLLARYLTQFLVTSGAILAKQALAGRRASSLACCSGVAKCLYKSPAEAAADLDSPKTIRESAGGATRRCETCGCYPKHTVALLVFRGAIGMTSQGFFMVSVRLLPLAEAVSLHTVYPVITALIAPCILGEPLTSASLAAAVIAVFGCSLITRGRLHRSAHGMHHGDGIINATATGPATSNTTAAATAAATAAGTAAATAGTAAATSNTTSTNAERNYSSLGIGVALAGAFSASITYLAIRKLMRRNAEAKSGQNRPSPGAEVVVWAYSVTALSMIIASLPWTASGLKLFDVPFSAWAALLAVGMTSVIEQLLVTLGFRGVSAAAGTLLLTLEAGFAFLFGTFFLHEPVMSQTALGAFCIAAAVVVTAAGPKICCFSKSEDRD